MMNTFSVSKSINNVISVGPNDSRSKYPRDEYIFFPDIGIVVKGGGKKGKQSMEIRGFIARFLTEIICLALDRIDKKDLVQITQLLTKLYKGFVVMFRDSVRSYEEIAIQAFIMHNGPLTSPFDFDKNELLSTYTQNLLSSPMLIKDNESFIRECISLRKIIRELIANDKKICKEYKIKRCAYMDKNATILISNPKYRGVLCL